MLAQSTSDKVTLVEVGYVAAFLGIVFGFAFALAKFHNLRHRWAWRPVLPLVDGTVRPGNGVNTSVMRGTWRGHPVVATSLPSSGLGPGEDPARYNRLVVRLFGLSGAADWTVTPGRNGWRVEAADPALAARLDAAGVARLAGDLGLPHDDPLPGITFDAAGQHLEINADSGRGSAPRPADFEVLLTAMLSIAAINAAVNPGS